MNTLRKTFKFIREVYPRNVAAFLALLSLSVLEAGYAAEEPRNQAKAGFACIDVTPKIKVPMAGFAVRENIPYQEINDRLYLKVAALEDGKGVKLVIVALDTLKWHRSMHEEAVNWFRKTCKLPARSLILNATHTHGAPKLYGTTPEILECRKQVMDAFKQGVSVALNKLEPVKITFGIHSADFGVSRRYPFPKGIQWRPWRQGIINRDLPIIAFHSRKSGKLRGLIYSYGCHPTSRGGKQWVKISADYPGEIAAGLKDIYGKEVQAIFLQGTGGDVKPEFARETSSGPRFRAASSSEMASLFRKRIASGIAVFADSDAMKPLNLDLAEAVKIVELPWDYDLSRTYPAEDFENRVRDSKLPEKDRKRAAEILAAHYKNGKIITSFKMKMQAVRFSPELLLFTMTGEIVSEYGLKIKALFPGKEVIVLGYSSYHTPLGSGGYIPTAAILKEGGYESWNSGSMIYKIIRKDSFRAPFSPDVEPRILNAARMLGNQVLKKD